MSRRTVLLAFVVLGAGASRASTQSQATLPSVGVEIVKIDAVVTDKQGRPVPGLLASDFEIREDGKAQELSAFSMEGRPPADTDQESPTASSPVSTAPTPEPSARTVAKPRGRQIVIAIDDLHIAPSNLVAARTALLRFAGEQLAEEDEVALVTTSGTMGLSQELTRDRATLKRALERLNLLQQRRVEANEVPHLTEYQAELIDRGDVEALRLAVAEIMQENTDIDEQLARSQAANRARTMLFEIMNYSGQSLRTLEAVVRGLAPLSGRKIVVLVSDGFLVGLGANDTHHYDLRQIVDAATRSGTVVYALDTRGLVSEPPGGDASFGGPFVAAAPGARESLQSRSVEALRDSMVALSEDTGGFVVSNSNDLSAGLGRIIRDNQLYYVLGYESTNRKRDGKFRKIEVKLRSSPEHKDLKVRTRKGYFVVDERKAVQGKKAPKDPGKDEGQEQRDQQFAQALGSLFPLTDIPVHLAVDYVEMLPEGPRAVVKAQVDVRNVGFERTAEAYQAEIEVAGAVFDDSGRRVAEIMGERSRLRLPLENTQVLREQGLLYEKTSPLAPGSYEVRLAVRDVRTALIGNASGRIEIPDRNAHSLSLSSVFLNADNGVPAAGGATLTDVQVEKRFTRKQGLHYLVYVYRSDDASADSAEVTLQAQLWSGDKLQGVGPLHSVHLPAPAEASPRQAERISLEPLPPGAYELRIVVKGKEPADTAERRVSFTLE